MLGIGRGGLLGDGARRHLAGENRVAPDVAGGEPRRGTRTHSRDAGADHQIRQRHPFGGADHGGDETHDMAPCFGGKGKNLLVRDW